AGAKRDHDEILHSLCSAIHHFTNRCLVCVDGERDGQPELTFHQFGERNDSLPWKIGSVFNSTGVIGTIRCAYSESFYLSDSSGLLDHRHESMMKVVDERVYLFMRAC